MNRMFAFDRLIMSKLYRGEPVSARLYVLWMVSWTCPTLVIAALAWCAMVVTP